MFNALHIFQNKLQHLREMLLVSVSIFWLFIICIVVISVNLVANIYRSKKLSSFKMLFTNYILYTVISVLMFILRICKKKYILRYIYKKDIKILLIDNIITTINHIKNDKKSSVSGCICAVQRQIHVYLSMLLLM